jgi:NADP-dependent 3-hydroxy acid dehydrogenase YdfG
MSAPLAGTVAMVTAASSGIGNAIARALAAQGAAVALVSRQPDPAEALATHVRERDGKALVIEADIADEAEARRAVDETALRLGRLDILVNNPGAMRAGPLAGAPIEDWKHMVEVNLLGLVYCAHAALPHLIAAAEQDPRHVTDLVNLGPMGGVLAITESLRQELTQRGVRIAVVEPDPGRARPVHPEDVADAVAYIVTRPAHVEIDALRIRPL